MKPPCYTRCTFDEKHKTENETMHLSWYSCSASEETSIKVSLLFRDTQMTSFMQQPRETQKKLQGETLFGTPRYDISMQKRKTEVGETN